VQAAIEQLPQLPSIKVRMKKLSVEYLEVKEQSHARLQLLTLHFQLWLEFRI
jgi:hypothetical protein